MQCLRKVVKYTVPPAIAIYAVTPSRLTLVQLTQSHPPPPLCSHLILCSLTSSPPLLHLRPRRKLSQRRLVLFAIQDIRQLARAHMPLARPEWERGPPTMCARLRFMRSLGMGRCTGRAVDAKRCGRLGRTDWTWQGRLDVSVWRRGGACVICVG
jgi:hypothetical protein